MTLYSQTDAGLHTGFTAVSSRAATHVFFLDQLIFFFCLPRAQRDFIKLFAWPEQQSNTNQKTSKSLNVWSLKQRLNQGQLAWLKILKDISPLVQGASPILTGRESQLLNLCGSIIIFWIGRDRWFEKGVKEVINTKVERASLKRGRSATPLIPYLQGCPFTKLKSWLIREDTFFWKLEVNALWEEI